MSVEIKLPDLGDGIDSGDVLSVLVSEGDQVAVDQGIIEIETDKATAEVPCPQAGRVAKVHVATGQTIPIGTVLVTLEPSATAAADPSPPPAPAATAPLVEEPSAVETPAEPVVPAAPESTPSIPAAAPPPVVPPPVDPAPVAAEVTQQEPPATSGSVSAGPAVRRFAREVGVVLDRVTGSGPRGRITREDVLNKVRQSNKSAPAAASESTTTAMAPEGADTDAWGPVEVERLSRIRKTIAAKMHQSWTTAPHVTNFDDADVTELERLRQVSKDDYAAAGVKLTAMPFVIKSVAQALKLHPAINASLDLENSRVLYKKYVNIGIAVDTDRGLVVPVLRGADQMSIPDLARKLAWLAEKVRGNDFAVDDLRGGTFTISNLGAIGGSYSTPIINSPEVAILLIGRSRKMPVVVGDEVKVRLLMPLSLSYDHRLVDGATAARFLNDVIGYLQSPSRLLLSPGD